ncbi:phosphatidylserine decarboxylase-domain-containing protein [Annulohypoxylon truncatum]|uniref:phosphatidylserine decarboxylase-domain-containing protein n=1 Tax=Annulohypoxylon truncatum TaxID=327061 RepID=UPI0020077F1A|nr:phosphatidylserine decarboxylase-domain-containing protein [Annulohypoxylon truncatum]KAI1209175.1 phosphatidylserine decarboxylase-domain-containing protein [Annulohypoxylon truncatum]
MPGLPTCSPVGFGRHPSAPYPYVPYAGELNSQFNPIIIMLVGYLEKLNKPHALDHAVKEAYQKSTKLMNTFNITGANSFLKFANDLLRWIPHESSEGKDVYNILCIFYFVFNQHPLKDIQTPITPDVVGQPLTWLSSWLVVYSQLVGQWMDTRDSLTAESLETFRQSPAYSMDEAEEPSGGWKTFNELFARSLKPGSRPIADPDDDTVIVYPADCRYDTSLEYHSVSISSTGTVLIKGLPWTISSLLQGSEFGDYFNGGVWMHAFLNAYNYHRQHAPVAGKVLEAKVVQGTCYLEVNDDGEPQRTIIGPGLQATEDYKIQAPDTPGYQFLQTRGIIVIENDTLGKVAVLPIGMALVSGVKLSVSAGQELKKGDEISNFLFGGSDIICVFEKKANLTPDCFVSSPDPPEEEPWNNYSKYGTKLAKAEPQA